MCDSIDVVCGGVQVIANLGIMKETLPNLYARFAAAHAIIEPQSTETINTKRIKEFAFPRNASERDAVGFVTPNPR